MDFLPDLATRTPLWLALLTVGVNALVGALRASIDDEHHWDIVGMATFAVLMGLGAIVAALLFGEVVSKASIVVATLDALALGLFAVIGAAYALRADLPVVAAIFVGTVSAVGGGVLVSVMKDEVPQILLASAPNALVATLSSGVYVAVEVSNTRAAAVAGVVAAIVAHFAADRLGLTSRRAVGASALLLTREKKR
ncbi:MAG: TRIC cation channel family protein [Actinomycetota bacterium]